MSTEEKIRYFIYENFLYDGTPDCLKNKDSFLENGILDSTGVIELVSFIEDNFGFHVEDNELAPENLDSIDAVISYINRKQKEYFNIPN